MIIDAVRAVMRQRRRVPAARVPVWQWRVRLVGPGPFDWSTEPDL